MTARAARKLLLHALLDDKLDTANAATCEVHLKTSADYRASFDRLKMLGGLLEDPTLRQTAPPGLNARIEAALPVRAAPAPSRLVRTALGTDFGAGLAVAASLLLALVPGPAAQEDVSHQLVDSHARSLLVGHLMDVATSDRHVVKPCFNGRIDFSPPTPDLKNHGFPVAGGRLDYVGGRVVPAIVY